MLWHVNDLGNGYGVESVQYFLDGKNVFTRIDPEGSLDDLDELQDSTSRRWRPANTRSRSTWFCAERGNKIFSYLESFQFKVQSSYNFTIEEGKVSLIRVVVDSKGGFKNFEDRPTVRYDERKHTYRETSEDGLVELPDDDDWPRPGAVVPTRLASGRRTMRSLRTDAVVLPLLLVFAGVGSGVVARDAARGVRP